LLPELESPEVAGAAATVRDAVAALKVNVDAIVLLSPHAVRAGVYAEVAGDLSAFGVPWIDARAETDDTLRAALGGDAIRGGVDHGVLVPLRLRAWDAPVVAVGVDSSTADLDLDVAGQVMVVASVNLSAGLSRRAPLTEIPGATERESAFIDDLRRDVGAASPDGLEGSCGRHVLRIFGRVFAGRRARVLAHEAPVGVGYAVAEVV